MCDGKQILQLQVNIAIFIELEVTVCKNVLKYCDSNQKTTSIQGGKWTRWDIAW